MLYKRIVLLCLAMVLILAGCQTPPLYNQTELNVAEVAQKAKEAEKKSDESGKALPPLVVRQGLYVDQTPVNLAKEPAWVKKHIILNGEQLPFSYFSRTIVGGMGKNILTTYQQGLDSTALVSLNYSGTVKGALDLLASRTGYVYSINDNQVYWQAFITKTFDIAFMPGAADYTLGDSGSGGGASSSSGGGGGSSSTTGGLNSGGSTSTLKGTISVWKDLEESIKSLLSPDGKVIVSQSTTSVTVRDKALNVDLVSKYIKNLNKNLSKQVLVKIQVYEVTLNSDFNFGIDWQVVKRGFFGTNFVLNANYGTPVSITPQAATGAYAGSFPIPAPPTGLPQAGVLNADPLHSTGVNLLISALQQQGKVSVVSEPRVVCLNNQVSVIQIVDKQGYAASVSSSAVAGSAGANSSSITSSVLPGTVVTGLILYILPKILNDKVFLQVNADLSSLLQIQQFTSGAGGSSPASIQVPHTAEKQFNQRSVIGSGDTLILSGFRKVSNSSGAMQLYDSQALGGKAAAQANSETIVLITPIILNGSV